jgi:hypothetical protein
VDSDPQIEIETERGQRTPPKPGSGGHAEKGVRPPAPTGSARKGPPLLICSAIALLILAAYNLVIHRMSASSQRRQLLAFLDHIPRDIDCVFLGNSLVEAGCDATSFRSHWPNVETSPRPVNIALGATSPVEHYLILKHALERNLHLKYVVYGFFDDQLNAPVKGDWADLIGNRALSYYFPAEAAELYAPGSALKKWQLELGSKIPMFSERSSLWGNVEILRRKFEDIGMPAHQKNRFGRAQDFAALEATDVSAFNRRCEAVVNDRAGFSAPINQIIRLAQQHEATVILVEMPMPSRHRTMFYSSPAWVALRARLQTLASEHHAIYVSASDWIKDDDDFMDVTHLNAHGAKDFSAQLASAISSLAVGTP